MANHRIDLSQSTLPTIDAKLLYITEAEYDTDWHSTPHIHPFAELFCITKGKGSFWIEDTLYEVNEDDIILINPNVNHTEMAIDKKPFSYIALGVGGINFLSFNDNNFAIVNYQEYKHEILYFLKSIVIEGNNKEPHYQEIANKLLEILLINMLRRSKDLGLEQVEDSHLSLQCAVVKQYIDRNFHQDITLEMLSELTHTSVYYLSHAYKEYIGMPIIDYLIDKRISEASLLLKTTNYSVTEIGSMVGYSSPSYFSTSFKNRTGMSPMRYRKTNLAISKQTEH